MDIFGWLVVGHLVGDWALQNDWMADGKRKHLVTLPGMAHPAVYTAAVLGALWLAGVRYPALYLWGSMAVFVSHWLIDALSIARLWVRFCLHSDRETVRMVVDQTMHLGILVVLIKLFHI